MTNSNDQQVFEQTISQEDVDEKYNDPKWIRPDEMIDTTKLQLKSLTAFAEALGYYFNKVNSKYFSSDDYDNKGRAIISFQTMCKLHNGWYSDNRHTNYMRYPFNFSTYKIRKARAAKIIKVCNLQVNKRTKYIRASSNIVRFEHQEYEGFLDVQYL